MPTLTSLLVGSYFRPPAGKVLLHLSAGTALVLRPEPENPYDEGALAVYITPHEALPKFQQPLLEQNLEGTGVSLEEVLAMTELHLGYVAKSEGKPLRGTPYVGNLELAAYRKAQLGFSPEGKPLVIVEAGE